VQGALPDAIERFRLDGGLGRERQPPRAPAPAEVVVRVAGVALGVEPDAEIAGTVVATGDAAAEWLGRRVVVPRLLPCGECARCRRGRPARCAARAPRAGLATHETVPARFLCSVEPPLGRAGEPLWRLAALADAAAAPFGALVRAGIGPGELLVVIGGGVRGRFACAIGRAKGAVPLVVDGDERRRARALETGARFALDTTLPPEATRDEAERLAAAAGLPTSGYKLVETTGTAAGRQRALGMLPDGGTAALLDGAERADAPGDARAPVPPPDWEALARREVEIVGASACHPDLYPELGALHARGELPLEREVAAVGVEEAGRAIAERLRGERLELPIVVLSDGDR
jgi:threonine dehydrogenase-like Zn-dependent dehydrogenase